MCFNCFCCHKAFPQWCGCIFPLQCSDSIVSWIAWLHGKTMGVNIPRGVSSSSSLLLPLLLHFWYVVCSIGEWYKTRPLLILPPSPSPSLAHSLSLPRSIPSLPRWFLSLPHASLSYFITIDHCVFTWLYRISLCYTLMMCVVAMCYSSVCVYECQWVT